MLCARPTAGPIPGMPDACQAIQEWGGLDSSLGLGAQACGGSRAGILDFHGTWPPPQPRLLQATDLLPGPLNLRNPGPRQCWRDVPAPRSPPQAAAVSMFSQVCPTTPGGGGIGNVRFLLYSQDIQLWTGLRELDPSQKIPCPSPGALLPFTRGHQKPQCQEGKGAGVSSLSTQPLPRVVSTQPHAQLSFQASERGALSYNSWF